VCLNQVRLRHLGQLFWESQGNPLLAAQQVTPPIRPRFVPFIPLQSEPSVAW
jgi:hypothetical protein